MSESTLVSSVLSRLSRRTRRVLARSPRRTPQQPEVLECRELLSAITVDALHDVTDPDDGQTTLREAITQANADPASHDTIVFDSALSFDKVELTRGQLVLQGSLTIDASANGLVRIGRGGENAHRIMHVASDADVQLRNVVIQDGRMFSNSGGAGIHNDGRLSITASIIGENSLFGARGGSGSHNIYQAIGGAGIYNSADGHLTLTETTVGSVPADSQLLADLGFDADRFEDNRTDSNGDPLQGQDGLYFVKANFGMAAGGGILNEGVMTITDSVIHGNIGRYGGGGIYNAGRATITDTVIDSNSSGIVGEIGGEGAGIFNSDQLRTAVLLKGRRSLTNGGYQFRETTYAGDPDLSLYNSTITNHSAWRGAGIYNEDARLTVQNSTISNGSVATAADAYSVLRYGGGGGMYVSGGEVRIRYSTLSDNVASSSHLITAGGALFTEGRRNAVLALNTTFSGNRADRGGAVYTHGDSRAVILFHSTITENTANREGGGIWATNTFSAIEGSIVAGNTAPTNPNIAGSGDTVLRSLGENLVGPVTGSEFDAEETDLINVTDAGLGPLGDHGGPTRTHALLPHSPAINALPDGISQQLDTDQRGNPRVDGSATDIGAVEAIPPATLRVDTLTDIVDGYYGPGELSLREALLWAEELPGPDTVGFADSLISDIRQRNEGPGTIVLESRLRLDGEVSIVGPGADIIAISGDERIGVVSVSAGATVGIHGVTIRDGRTTGEGAGIENFGNLTLTDAVITGNRSSGLSGHGGGIFNHHNSTLFMDGTTVHGNLAENAGGGVYLRGAATIANSTISNNIALQGGGMYGHQGTASIINSTVTENRGTTRGGAIRNWQTRLTVANSIIAGNQSTDQNELYTSDPNRQISDGNNFIGEASPGFSHGTNNDQVGTATAPLDPMLGALSAAGVTVPVHRPLPGSAVIDAGRITDFRVDQLDIPRGEQDAPEIGAIEFAMPVLPAGPIRVTQATGLTDGYFSSDYVQLEEAIILARLRPGADEIVIDADLADEVIEVLGSAIQIDSDVTITGSGRNSIDADQLSRIFHIEPGVTVALHDLVLMGGRTTEAGGAILNEGTLTIDGLWIDTSTAVGDGGAIANTGTLELYNSTISNSGATRGGGLFSTGELSVVNSTLSGNSAASGGNAFIESGTARFESATVAHGTAGHHGAGGIRTAADGRTTVKNTIVALNDDNTAAGDFITDGQASSDGGNLIGAASSNLGFTPKATDQVGTTLNHIRPLLTDLVISNSAMPLHALLPGSPALNSAIAGTQTDQRGLPRPQGSAGDVGAFEMAPIAFDGPLVVDNLGTELNGSYGPGDLNLREAILLTNEYDSAAGADIIEFSPAMIDEVIASENGSATIAVGGTRFTHPWGYHITDDVIIRDPAAHREDVDGHDVITISGDNDRTLFRVDSDASVQIEGLRLANAGGHTGAIYLLRADLALDDVVIEDGDSRAINNELGQLSIRDSVLRNNRQNSGGGAILTSGTTDIFRSVITQNHTNGSGGAIQAYDGTLSVDRSELSHNTAGSHGGGVHLSSGSAVISYSTISGNRATESGGTGGGIATEAATTISLTNVTIAHNEAAVAGGGRFLGTTTLTNTLIALNEADAAPDGSGVVTAVSSLAGSAGFLPGGNGNIVAHPHIGPLAHNGGSTRTHQLRPGSPAIDAGVSGLAIVDQRGFSLVDIGAIGTGIPDIGAYEIQSVGSSGFRYAVQDQSQFGPGRALTYGFGFDDGRAGSSISTKPKFLGFEFDTGNLKAGHIATKSFDAKYGGEVNADFAGKLGFDLGFYVNSGSLDVAFEGKHNYVVDVTTDESGARGAAISSYVDVTDGSLYTVSPKVGAYLDLVMKLQAEVSATGCFVGCATKDFIDLNFDRTVELFSMNRQMEDYYGRAMFFAVGEVFVRDASDYNDANGGVFARAANGKFYDLADQSTPIDFYELRQGTYTKLDRAPVVPFLDGDIRYVSVQLIVQNALDSAKSAEEFKRLIQDELQKRKAGQQVEEAREKQNQASQDLERLNNERDAAIAARDNADTAGEWVQQQRTVERLDNEIPAAEDRVIEANRDRKRVEDEFDRNHKKKNGKRKLKSPSQFIQVEFSEAEGSLLGAQADLVVGLGASSPFGNIGFSKRIGGMQVTMPDINLGTNQTDTSGTLHASTDTFPTGSELDEKRQLADLKIDVASLLGVYFGLPAGQYNVSLGPLALDVTTVSYDLGPQLNVTQDVSAEPVVEGMTYRFFTVAQGDSLDHDDDPATPDLQSGNVPGAPLAVDVEIDGVLYEDRTEIQYQPGQHVRVLEGAEPILVVPSIEMDTRISNDIGLEVSLKGELEAFAFALSAFGYDVLSVDPLLTHKHTFGTIDLGSVFTKVFEIDDPQTVEMAAFTLFEVTENGQTAATAFQPAPSTGSANRTYFEQEMPANEHVFVRVDMLQPDSGPDGEDRYYSDLIITPLAGEAPSTLQVPDDRLTVKRSGNSFRVSGLTAEMVQQNQFVTFAMRFDTSGLNKIRTQRSMGSLVQPETDVTENLAAIDETALDRVSAAAVLTTDIDDDGLSLKTTDGQLLTRYIQGLRGEELIDGVIGDNASRTTSDDIVSFIEDTLSYSVHAGDQTFHSLDFDGNGAVNGFDGKLFRRYLDGLRGAKLVRRSLGKGATRRTGDEIVDFIERQRSTATRNEEQFGEVAQTTDDLFGLADALDYSGAKPGSSPYSAYAPTDAAEVQEYRLHKYRNWVDYTEVYYRNEDPANLLSREAEDNPIEFGRRRDDLLTVDQDNNGIADVFEEGIDDGLIVRSEFRGRLGVHQPLFVKSPDAAGHWFRLLTSHQFASITVDRRVGDNLLLGEHFDLFVHRDGQWQFEGTISEEEHAVRDGYLVYDFETPVDHFLIYGTRLPDEAASGDENLAGTDYLVTTGFRFTNPEGITAKPQLEVRQLAARGPVIAADPIRVEAPHTDELLQKEISIARQLDDVTVTVDSELHRFLMIDTSEVEIVGNDATADTFLVDGSGGPLRTKLIFDGGFRNDEIRFTTEGSHLNLADGEHEIRNIELIDIRGSGDNSLILDLDVVRTNDPVNKTLRVLRHADDKLVRRAGWARDGAEESGGYTWKRWVQDDATLLIATVEESAGIALSGQFDAEDSDLFFRNMTEEDEDLFAF